MSRLYSGVLIIPLVMNPMWKIETYSKIKPNKVSFNNKELLIEVKKSASPLIYSFEAPKKISGFRVVGEFKGLPKMDNYSHQGQIGFDDYPLRVGFIIKGEKKLNYLSRLISPEWLKKLYDSLATERGIDRIEFFNVTQNKNELLKRRQHPNSSILFENFFAYVETPIKFDFNYRFGSSLEVDGIWISSDGDDTNSNYDVVLRNLILNEEDKLN